MKLLLLPKIKIQNANALSSPLTVGFPAMTAWLGAVHAMERKLRAVNAIFSNLKLESVAVINHEFHLHAYKGDGDYVHSLVGMGVPLDKNGNRSPFIEEARCRLTVSLAIEYSGFDYDDRDELFKAIHVILNGQMKMAGGDIIGFEKPVIHTVVTGESMRVLKRALMPGFAIVERRDLMQKEMLSGMDALDAMLEYAKIMNRSSVDVKNKVEWISTRKEKGWIVPIAVGFHGISALGVVKNQRDAKTQHRFAEAVLTLGEFKMVHHINDMNNILWRSSVKHADNLYVCEQKNQFN